MTRKLANEAATTQFPLVKHATEVGWTALTPEEALRKRGGESGGFLYDELRAALLRLNPGVVTEANVEGIIQTMESVPATIEGNRELLQWLRGRRTIFDEGTKRRLNVTVMDLGFWQNNIHHVTWEWTCRVRGEENRADVIFLINGIPVAIVENKNPKLADAIVRGLGQLRRYEAETPEMLVAPQVFNVTHLIQYYYGVTWNYARQGVYNWKARPEESYREAVQTFFEPGHFHRLLRDWILFYVKDDELRKTVLRQHQTRAVEKVLDRCAEGTKRRGLVWHTQGSGKTFTLLTAARQILENPARFPGATVVLVVDRTELEGQLSGWVERVLRDMGQAEIAIEEVETRRHLEELLRGDFRGLIVSMIHKFDGLPKDLRQDRSIYVFIDEAHRSVGGDLGNYLLGALPNATLIGFTGTPIDRTAYGLGTFKTFGADDRLGYLDKYTIKESIEDGTTLKLRHALAPVALTVPEEILDKEFFALAESEGVTDIEDLNRILERAVQLKTLLKAPERVAQVARFVAEHFRENVNPLGYKAFLVAVDREACALYKEALDKLLPPEWVVPIYTPNAADAVERPLVAKYQLDQVEEKGARKQFPKPGTDPRLFIVTDKLLTGFDAPILYAMYLDKPMRDHVLLQAVARVNRPYEDERGDAKPCGLIVDFVGVLRDLTKALAFDSGDVGGVIEDLELLLKQFISAMKGPARRYLVSMSGPGGNDEILHRVIYEEMISRESRKAFAELFQEIQGLYEILSPSPELRDYIEDYGRLADLYAMLRNAYAGSPFLLGDVARKTEKLVQEQVHAPSAAVVTKEAEFGAEALDALRRNGGTDNSTVVNLVRALEKEAGQVGAVPALTSIAERARAVLEALEDRQVTTTQALTQLGLLMEERDAQERDRLALGLEGPVYAVYQVLHPRYPESAVTLAREIGAAKERFPAAKASEDEYRQLKGEVYKALLRVADREELIGLGDQVLAALGL